MTIGEHIDEFAGLPVRDYEFGTPLKNVAAMAPRLSLGYEASEGGREFNDVLGQFLSDHETSQLKALVVGEWGSAAEGTSSAEVVEALVAARDQFPALHALFLGEMTYEESEISWIQQTDVSPLYLAFPNLVDLYLRGGNGLSLGRPHHEKLQTLVIQAGGLNGQILREIASGELPALKHLELWLGTDEYGRTVTPQDLTTLLGSSTASQLTYLGLRNDAEADITAQVLADHGIPESIEVLDLSLGALGDIGARALAACPWLPTLNKLDVHHHFIDDEALASLKERVPDLDASEPQTAEEYGDETYRFITASE